jgi:hypothetical protein
MPLDFSWLLEFIGGGQEKLKELFTHATILFSIGASAFHSQKEIKARLNDFIKSAVKHSHSLSNKPELPANFEISAETMKGIRRVLRSPSDALFNATFDSTAKTWTVTIKRDPEIPPIEQYNIMYKVSKQPVSEYISAPSVLGQDSRSIWLIFCY